jgi:amino acid transporter
VSLGTTISSVPWGYIISLVVIAITLITGLFGIEVYKKINKVSFFVYIITAVLFIIGLAYAIQLNFPTSFTAGMLRYNVTYSQVQTAISANPQLNGFNPWNTLLAIVPLGFLTYSGFNFNTYLAGETRNAEKTFPRSLALAVIVTLVALAIITSLANLSLGASFIGGISYLYNTGALSSVPVQPTINFLLSLALPACLGFLINLGVILGFFLVALSYIMTFSRILFGMAFDRVIPERLASVNERFSSPVWAIILISAISVVFTTFWWYAGLVYGFLNGTFALDVGYLIPSLAALLFPFVAKDLYQNTVVHLGGWFSKKIAGVPVISLGGVAMIGIWGFSLFSLVDPAIAYTYLGAALPAALGTTIGMIIAGIVLFEVSRASYNGKGLDLRLVYKEIPPE